MKIGLQSLAYQTNSELFEEILKRGFDAAELVTGYNRPVDRMGKNEIRSIKEFSRNYAIDLAVHLSPQWFLGSVIPVTNKYSSLASKKCLEFAREIGANVCTIHCFDDFSAYYPEALKQKSIMVLGEQLTELIKSAENLGVTVSLELYPQFDKKWARKAISPKILGNIVSDFNSRNLKLTFDVEHINSHFYNPITFLKEFRKNIAHVHLSDNDGKHLHQHLPVGEGNLPIKDCIDFLKKTNYKGLLIIEVNKVEKIVRSYLGILKMMN